jgi:molybdenum cofactor cytidylyltransferase
MFRLARELMDLNLRVVTTTTTRIFVSQMDAAPRALIAEDANETLKQLPDALYEHGHVLVVRRTDRATNKAFGIEPELADRIAGIEAVDALIVEADGARMRPLKAPAGHEPVIPDCATLVVPMAGVEAIGQPLDEVVVHRPERVAALTTAKPGECITPGMVAKVLAHPHGGRQHVPQGARFIPLLNKVDTRERLVTARHVVRDLVRQSHVDSVALGATGGADDPVCEVWGRVAAVVLAAGAATRFGQPKLLMPWAKTTMLGEVLDRALTSRGVTEVVVVVGCESERVAEAVGDRPVRFVANEEWTEGQASSLRAGLADLSPEVSAVLFLLGDQPGVEPAVIEALVVRHRQTLAPIVVPSYCGKRGNPVLFDRALFRELSQLSGDTGGRALLQRFESTLERVAFSVPPPFDVDTPEEYRLRVP